MFYQHFASDIGIEQKYLPASSYNTQDDIDYISNWTSNNLMKLNATKCNYMVFTRTAENFATRLFVNNKFLEKVSVTKLLGVWISEVQKLQRDL